MSGHQSAVGGLNGEGEAFSDADGEPVSGGWRLPLVCEILPRPPAKIRRRSTDATFPVASEHYSASRYLLEIGATGEMILDSDLAACPGDLILLDADQRIWWCRPEVLHGRLCGVRLERASGDDFMLIRIRHQLLPGDGGYRLWGRRPAPEPPAQSRRRELLNIRHKAARRSEHKSGSAAVSPSGDPRQAETQLQLGDVVALAILLIRML